MNKYRIIIKRMLLTCRLLFREILTYVYSAIGYTKIIMYFDKNKVNKLEIGAGRSKKRGFITLDLNLQNDYPFDLKMGLPFPANSIDFIYSEHVFEHFTYRELTFLLDECFRVLKDKGKISISVPNTEIWINAYFDNKANFDTERYCGYDCGLSYSSKIDYLNYIFYMDGQHHYMFDKQNIISILKDTGFSNVQIRDFSGDLDSKERRHTSLYAKAEKI